MVLGDPGDPNILEDSTVQITSAPMAIDHNLRCHLFAEPPSGIRLAVHHDDRGLGIHARRFDGTSGMGIISTMARFSARAIIPSTVKVTGFPCWHDSTRAFRPSMLASESGSGLMWETTTRR